VTTLKLAWRLAFSRDVRQRWRQVSVIACAFLATAIALLAVAVAHLAQQSDARIAARSPVWAMSNGAMSAEGAVLRVSPRALTIPELGQFSVVWLEPMPGHENDPAVIPPGLSRLPGPGEGVISPGLATRGINAEDLGLRRSSAGLGPGGTIGTEGLSTLSEGRLYARPAPGRSLGEGGAILYSTGFPGSTTSRMDLETIPEVPRTAASLVGVAWMLLAPAGFLLLSAARAMSSIRDARAATLWRLGIASGQIRRILIAETAALSLAGAVPAACLATAVLARTSTVPLTPATLLPGDLSISPPIIVITALATTAFACLGAAVGRIRDRSIERDSRTVRAWHAIPLGVAFSMMAVGPWLPPTSQVRQYLLFGGLLLTFISLPMALPAVVARLGAILSASGQPAVWLAGRRMRLRSANLAKPAAMVGALVFVAGAAFALYDHLVATEDNVGSDAVFSAFAVDWRDTHPADLATARSLSTGLTVMSMSTGMSTGAAPARPNAHFPDCADLQRWVDAVPLTACDANGSVSPATTQYFQTMTRLTPVIKPDPPDLAEGVLILADRGTTEQDVMKKLAGTFPAVNIHPIGGLSKVRDPQAGWMLAGWTLATLLLSGALIREIGDRGLSSMRDMSHLFRLGLHREEVERSYRWSLLPPVVVAIPIGFLGAVFFALLGYELGMTINNLVKIAAVAGAAGTLSLATFAVVFAIQRRILNLTT